MEFSETMRFLSEVANNKSYVRYDFVNGQLVVVMNVEDNVPELFRQAFEMFANY